MAHLEHYHTRFEFGRFYHIYNRCVDKQPLFRNAENCRFFLRRYREYIWPVADTLAYCLMGNHFHVLIRVREEPYYRLLAEGGEELVCLSEGGVLRRRLVDADMGQRGSRVRGRGRTLALTTFKKLSKLGAGPGPGLEWDPDKPLPFTAHDIIYPQFRRLFQSYAQAFNKQHNRCGTLFQTPFKRALLPSPADVRQAVRYIHFNPVHHQACFKPDEYAWSSLQQIKNSRNQWLDIHSLIHIFGSEDDFNLHHQEIEHDENRAAMHHPHAPTFEY